MSTTYPGNLPRPQRDGYTITVTPQTAPTARERTERRVRRIGLASRVAVEFHWIFTDAEFQDFEAWWRQDLAMGTAVATIQLPFANTDQAETVRFLAPYQADDLDGGWRVSVKADMLSPPHQAGVA